MTTLPQEFPPLSRALDRTLLTMATESPRLDARVREFARIKFTEGVVPPVQDYHTVNDEGKALIGLKQTFHYLLTDSPETKEWLATTRYPSKFETWLNKGGLVGEQEDLLAFSSHGGITKANWTTPRGLTDSSFLFGPSWLSSESSQKEVFATSLKALLEEAPDMTAKLLHEIKDPETRIALKKLAKELVPGVSIPEERNAWHALTSPPTGKNEKLFDLLLQFVTQTSAEDHVTAYVDKAYRDDSLRISKPLDAIYKKNLRTLAALTSLPSLPIAPGETPVDHLTPAATTAYEIFISELSSASLEGIPCDFIRQSLAEKMEQPSDTLPQFLARNMNKRMPGGKLVSQRFYECVDELIVELNHTFALRGLTGLNELRERTLGRAPKPAVVSPETIAKRSYIDCVKRDDKAGFEAFLNDHPLSGFKDAVLHRYWELCKELREAGTLPTDEGDFNWSLNNWKGSPKFMGQAISEAFSTLAS